MKKLVLLTVLAAGLAIALTGCNVTRTVTTKSEYWQKGDTMQRDADGDDEIGVLAERRHKLRDPDQDDREL